MNEWLKQLLGVQCIHIDAILRRWYSLCCVFNVVTMVWIFHIEIHPYVCLCITNVAFDYWTVWELRTDVFIPQNTLQLIGSSLNPRKTAIIHPYHLNANTNWKFNLYCSVCFLFSYATFLVTIYVHRFFFFVISLFCSLIN